LTTEKSPEAFRTISEVSAWLDTPAHVLRFWESRFTQVKPVKRAGGRRYYRPSDMMLLGGIKRLLHDEGLTIRGVQKIIREQGVKSVAALSQPLEDEVDLDGASDILEAIEAETATIAGRQVPGPDPGPAILPGLDLSEAAPGPAPRRSDPAGPRAAARSEMEASDRLGVRPGPDASSGSADPGAASGGSAGPSTDEEPASRPDLTLGQRPGQNTGQPGAEPERLSPSRHPRQENAAEPPKTDAAEDGEDAPAEAAQSPSAPAEGSPDEAAESVGTTAPAAAPATECPPEETMQEAPPVTSPPSDEDIPAPPPAAQPARPRPLGAELPQTDPDDDDPAFTAPAPGPRAAPRSATLRRALAANPARFRAVRSRLTALAARMDEVDAAE